MLIYSDENLEVIHRPGSSPYLLVTFSPIDFPSNGARFWAQSFCEKADIAALGFVSRSNNWFPAASVVKAVSAAATVLRQAPERILYGHSQGGYAALRYRRRLNADVTIAFCPQTSIDPKAVPFDSRFTRYFSPSLHSHMAIAHDHTAGRAYLFYDPFHALDRWHAEQVAMRQANTSLVRVHMTGHGTVRAFAGTARGLSLIESCREDDIAALRTLARTVRASAPMRPCQIALTAITRHPVWADRLHARFGDGFQTADRVNFLYRRANRHIRDGELPAARDILTEAITIQPGNRAVAQRLEELSALVAQRREAVTS